MTAIQFWAMLDQWGFAAARVLLTMLWQSSILFVATAALTWMLHRRPASARRMLWLAALLLAPMLPFLTSVATYTGAPQAPVSVLPVRKKPVATPMALRLSPEPISYPIPNGFSSCLDIAEAKLY